VRDDERHARWPRRPLDFRRQRARVDPRMSAAERSLRVRSPPRVRPVRARREQLRWPRTLARSSDRAGLCRSLRHRATAARQRSKRETTNPERASTRPEHDVECSGIVAARNELAG
jgi:hypothetical protein